MVLKNKFFTILIIIFLLVTYSCNNQITNNEKVNSSNESNRSMTNPDDSSDLIYRYFKGTDKYLKEINVSGKSYFYIEMQAKGKKNPIPPHYSTSEATAYGMRLAIYGFKSITGNGQGASYGKAFFKRTFDSLWKTQSQFKSTEDSRLHSWIIPKSLDRRDSSASKTDAELDLAYALLQAHKLWGSHDIDYKYEAEKILDGIAYSLTNTVNISGRNITFLKVGDWMENSNGNAFYSRTSDWMLHHLKTFIMFYVNEGGIGTNTFNTFNDLLEDTEYLYESDLFNGLLPDFVHFDRRKNSIEPAIPGSQFDLDMDENVLIDHFSWNACRVPWRLAMDIVLNNDSHFSSNSARSALREYYRRIYSENNKNSNAIGSGYELNGREAVPYYSVAFAAPIVSSVYYLKVFNFSTAWYVNEIKSRELPVLISKYRGNGDWGYYGDSILCFNVLLLEKNLDILEPPY